LGEVVLVVVGILIALQVNNWNEERKLDQQRQELIENLKTDFRASLQTIEEDSQRLTENNEGLQEFLRLSVGENEHLSIEELKLLIRKGYMPLGTLPLVNAYDSAVNSGAINLIQDEYLEEQFMGFENGRKGFEVFIDMVRVQTIAGESAQLRKELGSAALMMGDIAGFAGGGITLEEPEAFKVSDEAFRAFIARKDIYSMFENRLILRGRVGTQFRRMKVATENILERLEEL
jgi:phosphoenolpyruvate synthase/pyruvate phosphate dikinase